MERILGLLYGLRDLLGNFICRISESLSQSVAVDDLYIIYFLVYFRLLFGINLCICRDQSNLREWLIMSWVFYMDENLQSTYKTNDGCEPSNVQYDGLICVQTMPLVFEFLLSVLKQIEPQNLVKFLMSALSNICKLNYCPLDH